MLGIILAKLELRCLEDSSEILTWPSAKTRPAWAGVSLEMRDLGLWSKMRRSSLRVSFTTWEMTSCRTQGKTRREEGGTNSLGRGGWLVTAAGEVGVEGGW